MNHLLTYLVTVNFVLKISTLVTAALWTAQNNFAFLCLLRNL